MLELYNVILAFESTLLRNHSPSLFRVLLIVCTILRINAFFYVNIATQITVKSLINKR